MDDLQEMRWKESPDDKWILENWKPKQIRELFCDVEYWGKKALKWESIRQYRKSHREELKVWRGMEKPTPFENLDNERERVKRVRSTAPKVGDAALKLVNFQVPEEHAIFHQELEEALNDKGYVSKASWTDWQALTKNAEGEAEIHDLHRKRFDVVFEHEPLWKPISPIRMQKPIRRAPERAKAPSEFSTTVICPDLQFPFVDPKALEIFYRVLKDAKPDQVVQLGDALDMTPYSKFIDSEIYADSMNEALRQAVEFFATVRTLARSAKIVYLEGNHELRGPKDILANHARNYQIRPKGDMSQDPLLSVPHMLGLKDLDVEYLPGYPNNRYWINDNLQIIHGSTVGKGESKRVNFQEKISTIHGHTHRLGHDYQTINHRGGGEYRRVQNAGTLSRIDTHVPSTKSGYDLSGEPIGGHHENWQHGFCVITHNDNQFFIEEVPIDTFNGYSTLFRGKLYEPSDPQG